MRSVLYAYFGHHKCASQWIKSIVWDICQYSGLNFDAVYNTKLGVQRLPDFVEARHLDFLAYVTARKEQVSLLPEFKGFHVIRDPRDICVSAYYSHLYSHPITEYNASSMQATRAELKNLSIEQGLQKVIQDRHEQFEAMYNWDYAQPHILELRLEKLTQNPYRGFLQIFDHLGLLDKDRFSIKHRLNYLARNLLNLVRVKSKGAIPLRVYITTFPAEIVLGSVYTNRFEAKSGGRQTGIEDQQNHYRKGIAGDWVNYFTSEHTAYFKQNYNDLLVKLGYEENANW